METPSAIQISGAGPAGMAAALAAERSGVHAVVYEQRANVGGRFRGDFQGLENWTSEIDVLEELSELGIEPGFEHFAVREAVFFGPDGQEHVYRSARPAFYLVRRGSDTGTLDAGLKKTCLSEGVEFRFLQRRDYLPDGGVVAQGPHRPNVIAVGYVFTSESADGAFAVLSDELAPKGYSYLLIQGGRGTVAACLFDNFHEEKLYLERTVTFFREKVGFDMKNARRFGGLGNFHWVDSARRGRIILAGEAAGFQDALWGFGLRYAMLSGYLAGRALSRGEPERFDRLWKERLGGLLRTSVVNRYLYELAGSSGYRWLLRALDGSDDVREWLRAHYSPRRWKRLLTPLARRAIRGREERVCAMPGCDCTWCRCAHSETALSANHSRGGEAASV